MPNFLDKGVIIGEVSKGIVNLDFIRTSKRNYYVKEVDISNKVSYEEIKNKILEEVKEEERKSNLYKIVLKGEVESFVNLKEGLLKELIKDYFYYVKIMDKTEVKLDFDSISKDYSIRGVYAKKILEKIDTENSEENEIFKIALKLGIQCLSNEEVNLNDYK